MWKVQRSEVARAWNEVVGDSGEKVERYSSNRGYPVWLPARQVNY